ncbi:MAG: hypothetical protein QF464_17130, partial [Myxococcota bacterium]|nr:hypothetical protein [Myxococcota bacterium]
MNRRSYVWAATWALALAAACAGSDTVAPVAVPPSDGEAEVVASTDTGSPPDAQRVARRSEDDANVAHQAEVITPPLPGVGEVTGGGVWVVDSAGQAVGALVRRGSDDNLVYRAIYDLVTVYHPESGLFFEITMTDGLVRHPSTTF